jgi:hypothetical protein
MRASWATLGVGAALLVACGGRRETVAVPPRELGSLVPTGDIRGSFLYRQRVTAQRPGHEVSFEAVLQKQGETLTMLGLTPFGTRAFVLQQRGVAVEFTSYLPGELPFPPRYILLDLHRTLFVTLGPAPADGERSAVREGENVREVWRGGRLIERHYTRVDGNPAGSVDVRYDGGMVGHEPPDTVVYRNGWFGYTLTITTLARQALTEGDGGS